MELQPGHTRLKLHEWNRGDREILLLMELRPRHTGLKLHEWDRAGAGRGGTGPGSAGQRTGRYVASSCGVTLRR
ncbi:hypothetical protein AFB00_01560 [Pseudonocardia sp. HH130630-07]|nr:hypothetical protein AFB00_01560 [Pseudonocardia sp. HH130630-07]